MKFKENYFYSTISYAKEYSLYNLKKEKENILEELKKKENFFKEYDIDQKNILKNYDEAFILFDELESFAKKIVVVKKYYEPGFFKKKEKIDVTISTKDLDKLGQLFKNAFATLYKAYKRNKDVITKGLYTKISFDFYKLNPTGDYYNQRRKLNAEEERKSTPNYIFKKKIHAMGVETNTMRMFKSIPPGLELFNVTQVKESEIFFVREDEDSTFSSKQYKYKDLYSERAIRYLNKLADIINNSTWAGQDEYNGPFCYMALPDKKFYKELFNEEYEIRQKQLRQIELYIRAKTKQQKKEDDVGFVYVLKSVGYPGMYKIGSTYGLAEERAEELSGTNVPDPWTVASKIKIKDALYFEKLIHKLLAKYRYRKGREFFKIDIKIIKNCLKDVLTVSNKGTKRVASNNFKKFNY